MKATFVFAAWIAAVSFAGQLRAASICYGTSSNGALEGACELPVKGPNFQPYSSLGPLLGRTWVHCKVATIVADAYRSLESSHPSSTFMYGETGKKHGGPFRPHKTHQNGLSVDFMVPLKDESGASVPLPTSIFNKFGYDLEFTAKGELDDLEIDFEAMAAHLAAVKQQAEAAGVEIWRVIFDPELQPRLHEVGSWPKIKGLEFSRTRSWVRHDEHYHIDFIIPCRPLSEKN